jgi:hypothetical protein
MRESAALKRLREISAVRAQQAAAMPPGYIHDQGFSDDIANRPRCCGAKPLFAVALLAERLQDKLDV